MTPLILPHEKKDEAKPEVIFENPDVLINHGFVNFSMGRVAKQAKIVWVPSIFTLR